MDFITARKQFVKQQQNLRPGSSRKAPKKPTPIVALGCVVTQRRKGKVNQAMTQANFSLIQGLCTRSTQEESHTFPALSPRTTLDGVLTLPAILNDR